MILERLHFRHLYSIPTIVIGALISGWLALWVLNWGVLNATWNAASYSECTGGGACWAVIKDRYGLIMFGLYPFEERWRPTLACVLVVLVAILFQWPRLWRARTVAAAALTVGTVFLVLMYGGIFGLRFVPTDMWGGFALTLFIYSVGILVGMPGGICLAIMRRSKNRLVATPAAFIVDAIRTLPNVMILFSVAVLVPMLFPNWLMGDKLWRVALAFSLSYGCYQSEIVRAGLQAIPNAQEEAGIALAFSKYQRIRLILLPQAIKNGLPATVNLLVMSFKETSIVAIIGFFDFTASAQSAYGNAEWANAYIEVYLFIGCVYFLVASSMSWLGRRIEKRTRIGG
jgi:general L-amino acid transport system permease protein